MLLAKGHLWNFVRVSVFRLRRACVLRSTLTVFRQPFNFLTRTESMLNLQSHIMVPLLSDLILDRLSHGRKSQNGE